jgi:predicted permease
VETGRVEAFSDGVFAIAITFPTRVVADHATNDGDRQAATVLYGLTFTVTSVCFFAVWFYGSRRLLRSDTDMREVNGITRSYIPGAPTRARHGDCVRQLRR